MFRSKIAAVAIAAAIALTPLSANAQRGPGPIVVVGGGSTAGISFFAGCAVSIFITAAIAGHERNRELTMWEALTCGLLYYLDPEQGDNKNKKKKKKK